MSERRYVSRYRRVSIKRWQEPAFRTLSDEAKLLFLFLEQGPYTTSLPGLFSAGPAALHTRPGREHPNRLAVQGSEPRKSNRGKPEPMLKPPYDLTPNQLHQWPKAQECRRRAAMFTEHDPEREELIDLAAAIERDIHLIHEGDTP